MKRYVPIFITFTALLIGGHYIVYLLLANAFPTFQIQSVFVRLLLAFIIGASFLLASLAVSKTKNVLIQLIYRITAMWLGLFFYLFFAAVVWGVLIFFIPEVTLVAQISVSLALLVWLYGLINARIIRHKTINIHLKDLPDAWREKKIVMLSDLHFGAVNGIRYAKRIVREVQKINPDVVFIVGDFFDGVLVDEKSIVQIFEALKPKDGIFFVMGNHDEFSDNAEKERLLRAVGMNILDNQKVTLDGLEIIGVDYKTSIKEKDLEQILESLSIEKHTPNILLRHVPTHIKTAEKFGISLVLSGHTHAGQLYPSNFIASKVHQGFGYGLKSLGDTQVLVSSGIGTWGPPLRVGSHSELLILKLTK